MDLATILAIVAIVVGAAGLAAALWAGRQARALGLGLGPQAGPLLERLGQAGRRLEALEEGQANLAGDLARVGLRPAVVRYAPLGLSGARNCFVLALLNRQGDGVLLNYLAGTATRAELKEVRGWEGRGPALTAEEERAVAGCREGWG